VGGGGKTELWPTKIKGDTVKTLVYVLGSGQSNKDVHHYDLERGRSEKTGSANIEREELKDGTKDTQESRSVVSEETKDLRNGAVGSGATKRLGKHRQTMSQEGSCRLA